jgi:hypothetical protein
MLLQKVLDWGGADMVGRIPAALSHGRRIRFQDNVGHMAKKVYGIEKIIREIVKDLFEEEHQGMEVPSKQDMVHVCSFGAPR